MQVDFGNLYGSNIPNYGPNTDPILNNTYRKLKAAQSDAYFKSKFPKEAPKFNFNSSAPGVANALQGIQSVSDIVDDVDDIGFGDRAKNWFNNVKGNTKWSKSGGLQLGKTNVGKWSNIGSGVMQGANALSNLSNFSEQTDITDELTNDILRSAMSNPMANSYLTSEQESLLNQLRNGTFDDGGFDGGSFFKGVLGGLGNAVMPALIGFATGGVPGALIGGIGTLLNSGLQGNTENQARLNSQLEGLYSTLYNAEQQYRAMRRPNTTGLGLRDSAMAQMY